MNITGNTKAYKRDVFILFSGMFHGGVGGNLV